MNKTSSLSTPLSSVVLIIISLVLMILFSSFIFTNFIKTQDAIESQASKEPEPAIPTPSDPITLSREQVSVQNGEELILKANILNPTDRDWDFTDALYVPDSACGSDFDNICFINSTGDQECNTLANAQQNDNDCIGSLGCSQDTYCTIGQSNCNSDPDCTAKTGIDIVFSCDDKVTDKNFKTTINKIPLGEYKQVLILTNVRSDLPDSSSICYLSIYEDNNIHKKEGIVAIK